MITRQQMLPIMEESGALDVLDINQEDFLGGHGRARTHVKVIELAYALGLEAGISQQDPPGPCSSQVEIMNGPPPVRCDLLHGHAGDHRSGLTRWWGI